MSVGEGASPPPDGKAANLGNPEDVLHSINLVSQVLSITLITLFVALRMYTKSIVAPPFHTDDWMALMAFILTVGYNITALFMGRFGGGFHVYEISRERVFAITLVYTPASFFTKLALLCIVFRVFRLHRKTIVGTYAIIFFLTGYTIPVMFLKGFICRPLAGFWDSAVRTACYNQRAILLADTVVSALTDMAILCIPIPVAVTLRMSWKKRFKVIAMLSSGGIAAAASIIRLVLVIKLQNSHDETIDLIRFNLLGTAEVSIGLICACLPAVNILFLRGFERASDSSRGTIGSSRILELKFLRGSRLRTQRLTTTEVAPDPAREGVPDVSPGPTQEAREDYIFPVERISRPPAAKLQRDPETGESRDDWYSNVMASPFSEPGSPDWARKGVEY
ncbi:Satratoxin biosynthesis SC1 cluster protein 4 [Colletotrichum shisoi]|uniref:Satratoxin biosynthesis SC1 cluster protein 4 n=1 Tax=Colletotrichum shisoi TaxID=2078593 RepID=A0A5Q4BCM2_9PEZI|nr:Satratoxin biosynthesis SC1 cluster protein 4 [Colletotrichum shisoi]